MQRPNAEHTEGPSAKKDRFKHELVLDFMEELPHLGEGKAHINASHDPSRTCIAERRRKDKADLLRFVLSPQGVVIFDLKARLPGRGVWVSNRKKDVEQAVKKRAFHKAFKQDVIIADDFIDQIDRFLKEAALQYLSIANKAGLIVTGFSKVEEAAKRGDLIVLLHAIEAAEDGCQKLDRKFRAVCVERASQKAIRLKNCFTADEISLATGSINVIHAGLKEGGASSAFLSAHERWTTYRVGEDHETRTLCQGKE